MADGTVPGIRGAPRDRPVPRARRRPARRREAGRDARPVARGPAPDDGVPGPVVARRRDVHRAGGCRCRPVRDRAARGHGAADPAPDRAVPVPAASTARLRRGRARRLGRPARAVPDGGRRCVRVLPPRRGRPWRRAGGRRSSRCWARSPVRAAGRGHPRRVRTPRAARGAPRWHGSGAGRRPPRRPANRARPDASPPRP